MSDCGISSIAPFCRREESYSCRTEALEALFTTVSWNPVEAGGIFPKLKCVAGPNREQRHPPPRRRALGVLVRVDGVWSAGLTGGQHGVRTLQGRIDCVPTHAAAGGERTDCSRGKTMRPPTARPRINEDERDPHAKPLGVAVTVLSEESTFEAGRNAFAVWPRPVAVKRLSSEV